MSASAGRPSVPMLTGQIVRRAAKSRKRRENARSVAYGGGGSCPFQSEHESLEAEIAVSLIQTSKRSAIDLECSSKMLSSRALSYCDPELGKSMQKLQKSQKDAN